jgi:synaptic vesicle membrane protein VAT-1
LRKVIIHGPGGYEKLRLEEAQVPQPGVGQVLVEVEYAGVNFADCIVRWGLYDSAKQFVGWPITPGFEFSGKVAKTGSDVDDFQKGERVFGFLLFGAYASHLIVPRNQVYRIPDLLSGAQAAGFPAIFLTAYHAFFQCFAVRPGMNVLIHSAAGGVGSALVQLAKVAGCRAVGVVGASHKIKYVESLGADHVIDKSAGDLWRAAKRYCPQGYDVVFDANGYSTLFESYKHLAPTGKLVCYGFHSMFPKKGGRVNWLKLAYTYLKTPKFSPMQLTRDNKSIMAFNLSFLFGRSDLMSEGMSALLGWLNDGKIKAPAVEIFALDEVAKAHQALESGRTVGKLVLKI